DPPRQPIDEELRHVADHGKPAGHVSVERAVAGGELALVAGRKEHRAALVRKRHEEEAANASLEILLGDVLREAREDRRERLERRLERLLDGDVEKLDPEGARERFGVVDASLRRVPRRQGHAGDVLGSERASGDDRDERRIDAAAEPDERAIEAALVEEVARAEDERVEDLLELALADGVRVVGSGLGRSPRPRQLA